MYNMYLNTFKIPTLEEEDEILSERGSLNGGAFPYINNPYPCHIFPRKGISEFDFGRVTILYGSNGSGKSTILNLIAQKLRLNRIAPFNISETYNLYLDKCSYTTGFDDYGERLLIPRGSSIITSDEVFDYMLTSRMNNEEVVEIERAIIEGGATMTEINAQLKGKRETMDAAEKKLLTDYRFLRVPLRNGKKAKSRRQQIRKLIGDEIPLGSNGETALNYFNINLEDDKLYCLDEPENSLSPKLQIKLVDMLEQMARYCGCQFIIATHSPFILAMEGAKIYNLDVTPVGVMNWWELENTQEYFKFFYKHKENFLKLLK